MFFILFFGRIDLISEIIDLNGDSLYVILSYFFKISNNSSFFNVFCFFFTYTPLIPAINLNSCTDKFFTCSKSISYNR